MPSLARIAAFRALSAIAEGRVDLPAALVTSRRQLADPRDRALATEIVTGTLRWLRSLDYLIERFAGRPIGGIDADILHILRLSLYQLLHLDRVPASAAVDEAVDLARHVRKPRATGFVNAVLRSVLRERRLLPLPARPDSADRASAVAYLGITHSHPEWLVSRWLERYGFDAVERWVRFNNETPALTLRANTLKARREQVAAALAAEGVETIPTPHAPAGLRVVSGNPLHRSAGGSFFVQDEASQLVTLAVAASPGERVLDLCASPGGKTIAMAGDMGDTGLLVACDVRPRRMRLLQATVGSSGVRHVRLVHVGGGGDLPFAERLDRVLVDAPCSGLGTIRRDPDIRWRRQEADLGRFAESQLQLLRRAARVVRPGGRLVYATCSSEPEEDEEVVDAFLAEHPAYAPYDLRQDGSLLSAFLDERGRLRTFPFLHRLEAFFAAALIRR